MLSETSDFYAFTQDATVKVKETGMDLERRLKHEHFAKADSANASTYSCTAPVISPTPPRGNQTYGEKGQAVTPPGVVDVEKTAVTTKEGFWQRSDTVSIIDDHLNSPLILTVQFLDTNSEYYSDEIAKQIEDIANIWARYGYIEFKFVKFGAADIYIKLEPRIAKDKSGKIVKNKYNEPVRIAEYSSYIGRDAKGEVMNLCFPDWEHTSDAQKKRIILHEFGHALGFHHEHKNINLQIDYNIPGIVAYYKDKLGWSAKQTKTNTFGALDRSKWNFTEFDPNSIMLYPLQQFQKFNGKTYKLTNNPISFTYNTDLSEIDKAAIKRLYPGRHAKSKRTKSGNGLKTKVYKYSVSGKGDLRFGSFKSAYKDWNRKYVLPRGTIESIRNVTTRAHKGYVKEWTRYETDKIVVAGKIEPGATIYGRVDGYLEVIYLPE